MNPVFRVELHHLLNIHLLEKEEIQYLLKQKMMALPQLHIGFS
jgi:hypothetical protein